MRQPHLATALFRRGAMLFMALSVGLIVLPTPASADLLVTAQSVTGINPNSTGNALQVIVTNTGGSAVGIAGFSFGLSVTNTNIVFTLADISTTLTYIFGANGLAGNIISTTPPPNGQVVIASDLYAILGSEISLGAGQSMGLGRVLFDTGAIAPGTVVPITLTAPPTTSFTDKNGNAPPVNLTLATGTSITIAGVSAIPEPSTMTLAGVVGLILAGRAGVGRFRSRFRQAA